jgi:hypothetical protein
MGLAAKEKRSWLAAVFVRFNEGRHRNYFQAHLLERNHRSLIFQFGQRTDGFKSSEMGKLNVSFNIPCGRT